MYVYYQNNKTETLDSTQIKHPVYLKNIFDAQLELTAEFNSKDKVTITGTYPFPEIVPVDSLCLGNTNACRYKLTTREGEYSGIISGRITIKNFEMAFIDGWTLELEGTGDDKIYLGYLYIGQKIVLPRFAIQPDTGMTLTSEGSRSFGGQAFGMKRVTLDNFKASFTRLNLQEKETIKEYVKAVQDIEPHIIDPYHEAREEFPPMYVTLSSGDYSFPKRDEDGFYFSGSLSWQEAR